MGVAAEESLAAGLQIISDFCFVVGFFCQAVLLLF